MTVTSPGPPSGVSAAADGVSVAVAMTNATATGVVGPRMLLYRQVPRVAFKTTVHDYTSGVPIGTDATRRSVTGVWLWGSMLLSDGRGPAPG